MSNFEPYSLTEAFLFPLAAEPPPLATQQSAALAEKVPRARKRSKTASAATDETPSKPSATKQKSAGSLNGQTGEASSRGLFDSQPEVAMKSAVEGQDAEVDPYALPAETEKEAARLLTLSPAARLGMSPLNSTRSGDASDGVNASQEGPKNTDKFSKPSPEGSKASGSKKQSESVGRGRKRKGTEEKEMDAEEEGGELRDQADVGGSTGFGRSERSARKRAKPSYKEESGTEDEELDGKDTEDGASQLSKKRRGQEEEGKGEERRKQEPAKRSLTEEIVFEDEELSRKEDGALSLLEKRRRGKAKVEEELDTDERPTADENKVHSVQKRRKSGGSVLNEEGGAGVEKKVVSPAKRRKSGGLVLNENDGAGVEKKVVSPAKRRKSGALDEESVLNELGTQATVGQTQEVGPERKGKPRAAATLPLMMPDKVHRTKVSVKSGFVDSFMF